MNISHIVKGILGLGSVLALIMGLEIRAFARPGPPSWQQTEKTRVQNAAKASTALAAPAPKPADSRPSMVCAKCRNEAHEEFSVTKVGDKWVYRTAGVGTKHTCDACGGRITAIRGGTFNAMMDYCPICARARPNCWSADTIRALGILNQWLGVSRHSELGPINRNPD